MHKLQVPEYIPLRRELWRGFGVPELARTGVTAAVGTAAVFPIKLLHSGAEDMGVCLLAAAMAFAALGVAVFQKLDGRQSIYDYYRRQQHYRRTQQRFYYQKREVNLYFEEKETGR